MATLSRAPRIKVDGVAASAEVLGRLVDLRIDRRLNLTGSATIRCSGTQAGLPLKMGAKVEITAPAGEAAFTGYVTSVEVERYDSQHRITTFGMLDPSCKLRYNSRALTRLKARTSTVVSELAQEAGLSADVDNTPTQYEYLLQNGNDLDYLDGLVAREGLDWWCEGSTLFVKTLSGGNPSTKTVKAAELERLSVRASSLRPDKIVVRGWSTTHDAVAGEKDLQPSDLGATGAMADLATQGAQLGQQVHSTASLPVIDTSEANRLAEAAMIRSASAAVRAELEGPGLWDLGPADIVELADADDATGNYLVTEVQHRFADGVASSRIICGDRRPPAVDGGTGAIDPSSSVLHGIVVGQVTDINDPDKKGRVRARFPGLDEQQESHWARVSSISAGNGRGSSIRPDVGDDVLMAFEGGDLRKPLVLGSLFTSKTALPDLLLSQGGTFERTTMIHQFGHQFVMWSTSSDKGLEIRHENGASFWIDDKKISLKGAGNQEVTLIEQGQSSIELKNDGTVTIKGTKIVLTSASGDVELKGVNVKAEATTKVMVTGSVGVEIKGNAMAKLEAGGMLEVKGGIVKIN